MRIKRFLIPFLIAIANTFLIGFVPLYFYGFVIILIMWVCICGAIIAIDIFEKSHLWINAIYYLILGICSLFVGLNMWRL